MVRQTHFMAAKCLPLPIWVTTNFDTFLEDTFFEEGLEHGTDIVLSRPIRNVDFGSASSGGRTLIKIHGSVSNREPEQSIVITEEDYYRFLQRDRYIIDKLYTLFCERTIVFLGYSLSDPNIQFIYHEVLFDQKLVGSPGDSRSFSQIRPAIFVTHSPVPPEQRAYYKHKRIHYVENYTIERFFEELISTYAAFEQGRAHIAEKIRADLATYQAWYGGVTFNTNPDDLGLEEGDKVDALEKLLDLVELYEVVYKASGSTVAMAEFDTAQLGLCVLGILRIATGWCREFLAQGRTDILEMLLEFLRRRQGVRKSNVLRFVFEGHRTVS
ncbi:MAG: SIR2 family NAD-dependent protein deacylase [Acidobacteriaceae bacterium]